MTMGNGIVEIKKGREKPIRQQHPWIFSGAIHDVRGDPTPGDIVTVVDVHGTFLARGYWNPKSQIQVRILTWQDEAIDEAWWRRMLRRAIEGRLVDQKKMRGYVSAFRLINAENDFIPGLIVDKYNEWFVLQALTLGIDRNKRLIAGTLADVFMDIYQAAAPTENWEADDIKPTKGIYERSDVDSRRKEGLNSETGVLWGAEPPEWIHIREGELYFLVDVRKGHKTGFYLDQRENRDQFTRFIADDFTPVDGGHWVLNLFSYTGGFGLAALYGGFGLPGHITNVDASHEALEVAERNFQLFSDRGDRRPDYKHHTEFIQADVFDYLRDQVAEGNQWDVVILDPPKFAHNAGQVEKAARGYKDINLNAFKCVKPGGYLMTFSCSGAVSADLFQKIVFGALADSGRQAQILKHLGPGDDHPVALTFPEGAYLKGLLLRVY